MTINVRVTEPGVHTAVARITNSSVADPNLDNNTATQTLEAFERPSFVMTTYRGPRRFEPGERGTFVFEADNRSPWPATDVVVTGTLPEGGAFVSGEMHLTYNPVPVPCTIESGALVCRLESFQAEDFFDIVMEITAPERTDGGDFSIHAVVTSAEGDVDPADNEKTERAELVRHLIVSNVADEGSGSLRQAMLDVNALCHAPTPCAILFRIPAPVPESGWFTIQPRTPLPELAGSTRVDGRTQTIATGDTNPDGPEIEINGALLTEESGLRLLSDCEKDVRGLAVNGFPGYGIELRRPDGPRCVLQVLNVSENYLGTDPRGRIAKPNQRGIGAFGSTYVTIVSNLISGNLRAGIYAVGMYFIDISNNRIGVTADGKPLGNGASGVFVDVPATGNIRNNVIANNAHWAVARTRSGELEIVGNSIFDNVMQGIDVDLDLRTPNNEHDLGMPNHPVLYSATYEPARNATIVRGRIDSEGASYFPNFTIHVYASARLSVWSMPQAEQLVAADASAEGHRDLEIVVPGDLRGQWITATNTVSHFIGFAKTPSVTSEKKRPRTDAFDFPMNTSELSDAVYVQ